MASRLISRWYLGLIAMLILLGLSTLILNREDNIGIAKTSVISADTAVERALAHAQEDDVYFGGLIGAPTEIRGRVMKYGEAYQFVFNQPLDPNSVRGEMGNNPVWLIILRGKIIEHVPGSPGNPGKGIPNIPPKDVTHRQIAIILNANTADIMTTILIPLQQELVVDSIPIQQLPAAPIAPAPTQVPIKTVAPLPTATAAQPHP